jgi:endo-1,4-beta-xylanase
MKSFIFVLISILIFFSFTQNDEKGLKDYAEFPIGAAISAKLLRNVPQYGRTLEVECSSITAENALKWQGTHPEKDKYTFDDGDYIVDWAISKGKRAHGHVLLWHQFPPAWLRNFEGDSATFEALMKDHITTVVKHFKGRIKSWDVVNEAYDNNGLLRDKETNPNESWQNGSVWKQKLGNDFIARAFEYAHAADPKALLFYNDYAQESKPNKNDGIIKMVLELKKRKVPIHGIGLQMHISLKTPNEGIEKALKDAANTGLQVHISELDIIANTNKENPFDYTPEIQAKQKEKFRFVVSAYNRIVPEKQRYGITTWNLTDADSWLLRFHKVPDYPLLFDANYQRKSTWEGFKEGLIFDGERVNGGRSNGTRGTD